MPRPGQLGEEVPTLMRSTPRRPPLHWSVPIVALLLLAAWALLSDGGGRTEVRAAAAASLSEAPKLGATVLRTTVLRTNVLRATAATPAFPEAAELHPEPGSGLPALNAPPPLPPTAPTPLVKTPALLAKTPPPGVPVAETGAPVREAEDHSSALVPIALGLALTGAAVYKHRGLPGGH